MIVSWVIYFVGLTLVLISTILGPLNWLIPSEIPLAISDFIGHLAYLNGYIPIVPDPSLMGLVSTVGLISMVEWTLLIFLGIFLFRLLFKLLGMIPIIGHRIASFHKHKKDA